MKPIAPNDYSEAKKFALEVSDIFDKLMMPELKSKWTMKIYTFISSHVKQKLLNKPDSEIEEKMFLIYKKLHTKFQDVDMSVNLNQMKKDFPKLKLAGETAKKANLITIDEKKAADILRELNFHG